MITICKPLTTHIPDVSHSCENEYQGSYEVVSDPWYDTVMETSGKTMREDVIVKKIPYWETSNESGLTVYIGGEI